LKVDRYASTWRTALHSVALLLDAVNRQLEESAAAAAAAAVATAAAAAAIRASRAGSNRYARALG